MRYCAKRRVHVAGDICKSLRIGTCTHCGWTGVGTSEDAMHYCTVKGNIPINDTKFDNPVERMVFVHDVLHDPFMSKALGNIEDILDELDLVPIPVESILSRHRRRVRAKLHEDDYDILEYLPPSTRDVYVHRSDLDDDEWLVLLAVAAKFKQHHDEDSPLNLRLPSRFTPVQTRQRSAWSQPKGNDWLLEWFTQRTTTLHSTCCRGPLENKQPHVFLTVAGKVKRVDAATGSEVLGTDNYTCNHCKDSGFPKLCSSREWRVVANAFQLPFHYFPRLWLSAHGLFGWSGRVGKKAENETQDGGEPKAGKKVTKAKVMTTTTKAARKVATKATAAQQEGDGKATELPDENVAPKKKPKAGAEMAESEDGIDKAKEINKRKSAAVDDAEVAQTRKKRKT
uniref:Uncharacterized protein n=1 Tax=Mycena chlorophos TaxID=658473 RepID=A0ABQ0LCC4_MYCCL|nr:predicted protein [Mycena chlorophos]